MRAEERVYGGGGVLWCFADSLVLSSNNASEKDLPPLLGSTVGQAFFSVNELVRDGLPGAAEVLESARQARESVLPGR